MIKALPVLPAPPNAPKPSHWSPRLFEPIQKSFPNFIRASLYKSQNNPNNLKFDCNINDTMMPDNKASEAEDPLGVVKARYAPECQHETTFEVPKSTIRGLYKELGISDELYVFFETNP